MCPLRTSMRCSVALQNLLSLTYSCSDRIILTTTAAPQSPDLKNNAWIQLWLLFHYVLAVPLVHHTNPFNKLSSNIFREPGPKRSSRYAEMSSVPYQVVSHPPGNTDGWYPTPRGSMESGLELQPLELVAWYSPWLCNVLHLASYMPSLHLSFFSSKMGLKKKKGFSVKVERKNSSKALTMASITRQHLGDVSLGKKKITFKPWFYLLKGRCLGTLVADK